MALGKAKKDTKDDILEFKKFRFDIFTVTNVDVKFIYRKSFFRCQIKTTIIYFLGLGLKEDSTSKRSPRKVTVIRTIGDSMFLNLHFITSHVNQISINSGPNSKGNAPHNAHGSNASVQQNNVPPAQLLKLRTDFLSARVHEVQTCCKQVSEYYSLISTSK